MLSSILCVVFKISSDRSCIYMYTCLCVYFCCCRGFKDLDLDTPSIEKRFAYSFLQQLIRYVDEAHQYILEFGT